MVSREVDNEIRFAATVVLAAAASIAFSGPWLSGSAMFAGRIPWDALSVLAVVLPVYSGTLHTVPAWSSTVVALVGVGCLVHGPTSPLLRSVGTVLLFVAVAAAGWSDAAESFHAVSP